MKILNGFLFFTTLLFFLSFTTSATATRALYLSIDPAIVVTRPGLTQHINLYNNIGNTYVDRHQWQDEATLILGIGGRVFQSEHLEINTGFRFIPIDDLPLEGQIWQLDSPLFNNLDYSYQVKSNLFFFDNIISWTHYHFQPGVILGFGISTNTTSSFQEIPTSDTTIPSLQSANGKKTTQFAYELGAVLDYSMQEVVFELAYRYMNAGRGYLQPFSLQNTQEQLSTGMLHYHVISIGIRAYYAL